MVMAPTTEVAVGLPAPARDGTIEGLDILAGGK
jgi:hypothetical protein